jgi:cytochrome P450
MLPMMRDLICTFGIAVVAQGSDSSSVADPVPHIQASSAYDNADREVAAALNAKAQSNTFHQLFNAWAPGGIQTAASWIASDALTAGSSKASTKGDGRPMSVPSQYNPYGLCPLRTHADRMESARQVGGTLAQLVQAENELRAWLWSDGEDRPINPATDRVLHNTGPVLSLPFTPSWKDVGDALAMLVKLPTLVLTDSGNRTTWFNNAAKMTCWAPSPLADGPMVFKYPEVLSSLQDANQRRGFYTATAAQSLNFFSKGALIFLDGDRHVATRELLEHAGFARRYPIDLDIIGQIETLPAGDGSSVATSAVLQAVTPIVMASIWGVEPTLDVAESVKTYGSYGKYAIFGKEIDEWALGLVGITSKLVEARAKVTAWALKTPFAHLLQAARDDMFPSHPDFMDMEQLVADLSDASLFAGLVGTTDLVTKCVQYQQRDHIHVTLFKDDPEKYLIELMRFDSAVTSVTELLRKNTSTFIEGRNLTLAVGTPAQVVLATSNRDPTHWNDPDSFDPKRVDLSDTLSWNGRVRDVEARDFSKAPRHCPGHCLSLKVGAAVCAKLMGSFEELLQQGKLKTAVTCRNFHTSIELPDQPLWYPPAATTPSPSQPRPIAELVKSDTHCKSGHFSVGKFASVEECAHAVKAAGGKFFIFGKGMFSQGKCYIEYTDTRECPHGFESHSYDFYDIPEVPMDAYLRCHAEVVQVTQTDSNGNAVLAKGIMEKARFQDTPVALASYVRSESYLLFSSKVCRRESRLSCSGGIAKIDTFESCCYWSSSCQPSDELSHASETNLPDRNSQVQTCQSPEDSSFVADPPTRPRLQDPSVGGHECFTTAVASKSRTLREIFNSCPSAIGFGLDALASANAVSYKAMYALIPSWARNHPLAAVLGKTPDSSLLSPNVFDKYTIAQVVALVHLSLRSYGGRNLSPAARIAVPDQQAFLDRIRIYSWVGTPDHEIDSILNPADSVANDLLLCIFDTLREWDFTEEIDAGSNSWEMVLGGNPQQPSMCPNNAAQCTKKEFILGVFAGYTTQDGDPVYPAPMIDFSAQFQQGPGSPWQDKAEQFLAFGMIGSHRLEFLQGAARPEYQGQKALYRVATSGLAALAVRPGFAHVGADMYFDSDLEPVMIQTPSGNQVWRSEALDATWQYWKFAWRSSLFLMVTAVDHLWATHFSAANSLAAASREALPPAHPLRRLLSIFTFGTIGVNKNAAHQLVGPHHLLHRSTPFSDFGHVSEVAQATIPSLESSFGPFLDHEKFMMLDHAVGQTPYFADGKLLFGALRGLVDSWFGIYGADWCEEGGAVVDSNLEAFIERFEAWSMHQAHATTDSVWLQLRVDGTLSCGGLKRWLTVILFAVTGYHRHVGTVGDIAADPDFASFSWKEGEAYSRPLQHLQMALVAASTAKVMPKVLNDFGHLAAGLPKQEQAELSLRSFKDAMTNVAAKIEQNNAARAIPYSQMDPRYVECSVAV